MKNSFQLDYGIKIAVTGDGSGSGSVESNLLNEFYSCDDVEFQHEMGGILFEDGAADALESFLLALASEGVDIGTLPFRKALKTAVESIANNM